MKFVLVVAACLASTAPAQALAQTAAGNPAAVNPAAVNPAAALKESERAQERLRAKHRKAADMARPVADTLRRPTAVAPVGAQGNGFRLTRVVFTPSAFLSQAQLDALARPFVGTMVDAPALQRLTAAINHLYDARGILTGAAIIPKQNLAGGVLTIRLVEGRLGALTVSGAGYTTEAYLRRRLPLRDGEVIDLPLLDRRILLFNRMGETHIQGALRRGAKPGLTDLNLQVEEPKRSEVLVFVDNEGNDATNRNEVGLLARRASVLTDDDKAIAYGTWSQGNLQGSLSYELPVGPRGDRLGVSYAQNRINIVSGPFTELAISGRSQTAALTYRSALAVSQTFLLAANLGASWSRSTTTESGNLFSREAVPSATVGLSATYIQPNYYLAVSQNAAVVSSRRQGVARQRFVVFNGQFTGQYVLARGLVLDASAVWQLTTHDNLPAVLTFQVGGPTSVRGYPSSAISGDQGIYGNFTLRKSVPTPKGKLEIFAFADSGYATGALSRSEAIHSVGGGASWSLGRVTFEGGAAIPLSYPVLRKDDYRLFGRLTARLF